MFRPRALGLLPHESFDIGRNPASMTLTDQ